MNVKFQPYGDRAILINFEQRISVAINQQVIDLNKKIEAAQIFGVEYCIPAYCSLTVGFDFEKVSYEALVDILKELILNKKQTVQTNFSNKKTTRHLRIPVCYDEEFAPDLNEISQQTGLATDEIIRLHTAQIYRVCMLGFLPGFPYLGILPKELSVKRKATPRSKVPARSVGLAGLQTGIYPSDAPGGWQIIGQTPMDIFLENEAQPFLLNAGDEVQFYSISKEAFFTFQNGKTTSFS